MLTSRICTVTFPLYKSVDLFYGVSLGSIIAGFYHYYKGFTFGIKVAIQCNPLSLINTIFDKYTRSPGGCTIHFMFVFFIFHFLF